MKKHKNLIVPYILKFKWQYSAGLLTLFVVDFINLYIPQFTGEITDGLTSHLLNMNGVMLLVFKILMVAVLISIGRFLWRIFIFGSARKIEYLIRDDMFKKLETLSLRYYNENKTGDLMAHFTNDLSALRMSIGPAVIASFDAVVMSIMIIGKMMSYVDVKLTLIAMIPMLFIAIGGYYFGEQFERKFEKKQKAFADLSDYTQESVSGERVIKAFTQEVKQGEAFAKINQKNLKTTMQVVKLMAIVMPLLDLVIGISYAITIVYGGYLAIIGSISLGRFIAFNQYLGSLVWPMLAIGDAITSFSQGRAAISRISEIFQQESDIQNDERMLTDTAINGDIVFNNVSFKYKEGLPYANYLINLHIKKGETLAILGRLGAGKTTLVNLLLRIYDVSAGDILLDNVPIKQIPLKTLRESIAYVPQDNFLFSDTLKNNLIFGKLDASETQVQESCRDACVHDNIMEFACGYGTLVGERGVTLSGGQKQRSSIARALLKESPILILDDALSAVDTDTEEHILDNLKRKREAKTTIIIAHRISTIMNADHILVLEDGACAQYGTLSELLKVEGIFKKMYEKQQLEAQLERA